MSVLLENEYKLWSWLLSNFINSCRCVSLQFIFCNLLVNEHLVYKFLLKLDAQIPIFQFSHIFTYMTSFLLQTSFSQWHLFLNLLDCANWCVRKQHSISHCSQLCCEVRCPWCYSLCIRYVLRSFCESYFLQQGHQMFRIFCTSVGV